VQRAIRAIKDATPDLIVIADVCLCEYTDHGHCGVYDGVHVQNDATLPLLARTAVASAQAGAEIVAPSDMMDGRVAAVRRALDAEGLADTAILSYAAKYASAFYGPFRDAAESAPSTGDRKGYQMDPANVREALAEISTDLEEGADGHDHGQASSAVPGRDPCGAGCLSGSPLRLSGVRRVQSDSGGGGARLGR
jgi:porphobilinogen synthase